MRRTGVVAVLGALVLVTAACGGEAPTAGGGPAQEVSAPAASGTTPPGTTPSGTTPSQGAVPVPDRLAFTSKTLDGAAFDGASLAGGPAVLWFWAPWCPNCRREAPTVAAIARETQGEVAFVGVAAQDTEDAMREFVDERGVGDFPHLADTDAELWQRFGVTSQPAFAFITAEGDIEVVVDRFDEEGLRTKVGELAGR